jgi:hypothetical protein
MRRGWAAALAAVTAGAVWTGVADAAVSPARARALSAATAGLGVALSPTVPPVAPDAVLTTFSDPAGDDMAGRAPDLLGTSVWSDAAGIVTVRAEIPGVPELRPGDLYALFLDTDLDRTTGNSYAAGADAVIAIDGDTRTLGLARWTGIGWDFGVPQASLRGAWSGGPTISVDRAELGGTASFRFWEGASARDRTGASYMDVAPETGQWAHELSLAGPATGSGVIPDRAGPHVRALPSVGRRGRIAHLQYTVWDESGLTRERVQVYRGTRLVGTRSTALAPSRRGIAYWTGWRVPRRLSGPLRFCVRAWDEAGNASPRRCARLTLRP